MKRREFLSTAAGGSLLSLRAASGAAAEGAGPGATGSPPDKTQHARAAATQAPYHWSWWGWEPLDHYRRAGGVVGAVDAAASWCKAWYDRLHSEELVRMMAELGVDLAITHFFKGFGLKHERAEQERTAELVRFAHRHGIRVLGYCQSRSLYYEAFLAEQPTAEAWIQRDSLGQRRSWGSSYYRWAPCILSEEFRAYLKRVIRFGLEVVGLDGLHFDNDYAEPCYCQRCEQAFRRWLADRWPAPRERFGLDGFDHVRQPPTASSIGRIVDPLVQEWVRFRCEMLGQYHADITGYARSIRPGAILLGNPAHPRSLDVSYRRSVWPPYVGRHLNLMFAENGNSAAVRDGVVISQIRAHKQARALGYRVVSTTWRRGSETTLGLPDTAEAIALQVAEAAANGGVPGTNWALRPLGDGDRMQIDRPELRDALRQSLRFVKSHEGLLADAEPVRDVGVLYTFASLAFNPKDAWAHLLGAEEVLIRGGFAWEVVFGDDLSGLDRFAVLLVAGQSHLSDRQCEALGRFARQGGGLVLAGDCGTLDENGRQRAQGGLESLPPEPVVRVDGGAARSTVTAGYEIRVPLPKQWPALAASVEKAAREHWSVRLCGSDTMAISAYDLPGGGWAVYLVNYAAPETTKDARLELGPRWADARRARLLTPAGQQQRLNIRRDGPRATLELPRLPTYGLLLGEV